MKYGLRIFIVAAMLVVSSCRTTKTTYQTDLDSVAVRMAVQDSCRSDMHFRFDELDIWLDSVCSGMESVAQSKPHVAHIKVKGGEIRKTSDERLEVYKEVEEVQTETSQKVFKPPKSTFAVEMGIIIILLILLVVCIKQFRRP